MRDVGRIDMLMDDFRNLWKLVPDWRFGQLISNFLSWYGRDPFYVEDDKMSLMLSLYMENLMKNGYGEEEEM